jgi:hypothetical protein
LFIIAIASGLRGPTPPRRLGPENACQNDWRGLRIWWLFVEDDAAHVKALVAGFREQHLHIVAAADDHPVRCDRRDRVRGPRNDRDDARHARARVRPREADARVALAAQYIELPLHFETRTQTRRGIRDWRQPLRRLPESMGRRPAPQRL